MRAVLRQPRGKGSSKMRVLFMGTPDIAAQCLEALYAAGHEICGVIHPAG